MQIIFLCIMFVIGACVGSFLCCQARRLHFRTSGKSPKKLPARSICLNCKTKLKWYDNIPIISWLVLKGKCRTCSKKIGVGEILAEFGVGLAFFLVGLAIILEPIPLTFEIFFNQPIYAYLMFISLIVLILILLFLAIYDGLYGELPVLYLTISIICAIIITALKLWDIFSSFGFSWKTLIDPLGAALILGGLYLVLYLASKGKWVGDGDWLLGIAIGLTLGKPFLSLLALFLSNLLACLIMAPKAKGKNLKIPFGPFLISAFIIIYAFGGVFESFFF